MVGHPFVVTALGAANNCIKNNFCLQVFATIKMKVALNQTYKNVTFFLFAFSRLPLTAWKTY